MSMAILLGLGAFGSAQAQTNVQLYGVLDMGVEHFNKLASAGRGQSLTAVSQGGLVASRWGVRGSEDLGGGLRAEFNLESGIAPDSGQLLQSGRLFGRQAYVGIANKSVGVFFGRQRSALYDLGLSYDPLLYATYSLQGVDNGFVSRSDNTVKGNIKAGPVAATVFYSFGRDALAGTPAGSQSEVPGASKVGRQLGANLNYSSGPLSLGMAYDQQHGGTAATASDTDRRLMVAARYKAGDTTWIAGYQRRDNDIPAADQEIDLYWLGAMHQFGKGIQVNLGVYHSRLDDSDVRHSRVAVSLIKEMSKRTSLYANLGYLDNRGAGTQGMVGSAPTLAGDNQVGMIAGVVHRF